MTSEQLTLIITLGIGFLISFLYPHWEMIRGLSLSLIKTILEKLQTLLDSKNNDADIHDVDDTKSHFQSLAPTDDADENGKYSSALKWAFKQVSIKNIAVTGPFGAGKTSVLKTFEKRNPDIKILNISLASFSEEISENEPNRYVWRATKAREDERRQREYLIEKSILQQIIYKETNKALPMSRFERLSKVSGWSIWGKTIASALLILLVLLLLKLDSQTIANGLKIFPKLNLIYQLLIFLIASVFILSTTQFLRELLKNKNVNKVNLLKGDIELSEKTGASILNLHIDEIIYFFEETDYEVVILEDLDRFNGVEIFTKLREINTLLNQSKQLRHKKIVFIYAVKDDIFDEVSRTKFFDFIVPVIPIVNSSNSREILLKRLHASPYGTDVSDKLVSDLTLYVDDMRLILNIFNEYIIYSEMLMKQIALTPDKLLAFIFYKNKYPRDFSLLNKGRGSIAEAFDNKNSVILDLSKEIDEEIVQLERDIAETKARKNNEIVKNTKELRSLYLYKYLERSPELVAIKIEREVLNLSSLLNETAFNKLIEGKADHGLNQHNQRFQLPDFSEIENAMESELSYAQRLEVILDTDGEILKTLSEKLERLKEKKANLRGQSLAFLIEHYPYKKVTLLGKYANDKLLSYLLKNSLIDEGYYNYLSYFHPGSRTPQDVNFLLAVNEKKQLPITYKISSPEQIIKQLTSHELGSQYAMNLDLLDYMYSVSSPRLPDFLSNFEKFSGDGLDYVIAFLNYSHHGEEFIGNLAEKWYSFLFEALANSSITESNKFTLLKSVIQGSSPGTILNQNKDSVITSFISSSEMGTSLLLAVATDKSIEVLKKLKPKFTNIELFTQSPELFEFIVDFYFYSLNPENLKCIFEYYELNYEGSSPRLSDILQVSNPDINGYIKKNLNTYVSNVLFRLDDVIQESESSIISLLNNPQLNIENKQKVIQKLNFVLEDITDVDETLWPQLMRHKKIKVSWQNVFEASFRTEIETIQGELWRYVADEDVSELLSEQKIPDIYDADAPDFFKKIIQADGIGPAPLKKLIKSFSIEIESLSDYDHSAEVAGVLVKAGKVALTDENIQTLGDMSISHVEDLLIKNIAEFSDETSYIYQASSAELEQLLNNTNLPRENKLEIISKYQDSFVGESQLQDCAWNVIKGGHPFILLNDELVLEMTKRLASMSDKCLFLSTQVDQRDWASLSSLFIDTDIKILQQIASRRRTIKMNNTTGAARLVDSLLAKGHISSYSHEGDGDEKLKINSKRK